MDIWYKIFINNDLAECGILDDFELEVNKFSLRVRI
jgi:hypothetical protein